MYLGCQVNKGSWQMCSHKIRPLSWVGMPAACLYTLDLLPIKEWNDLYHQPQHQDTTIIHHDKRICQVKSAVWKNLNQQKQSTKIKCAYKYLLTNKKWKQMKTDCFLPGVQTIRSFTIEEGPFQSQRWNKCGGAIPTKSAVKEEYSCSASK